MTKLRLPLLCLLLLTFDIYAAQEARDENIVPAQKKYKIKLFNYSPFDTVGLGNPGGGEVEYTYRTNGGFYYGIDFSTRNIGLKLALKSDISTRDEAVFGETDFAAFSAYFLGKRHSIEGYYDKMKGYYLDDRGRDRRDSPIQRSDLCVMNAGIYYYYILSPETFSMKAAFNQSEIQKAGGGSFAMLVNPNLCTIQADSSLIEQEYEDLFEEDSRFRGGRFYSLALLPGYFHTFTWRNFFATPSFFIGGSPVYSDYIDSGKHREFDFSFTLATKFALGYNAELFIIGMDLTAACPHITLKKCSLSIFHSGVNVYIGTRL